MSGFICALIYQVCLIYEIPHTDNKQLLLQVIDLKHGVEQCQLIWCQELQYTLIQTRSLRALFLLHQINIWSKTMASTRIVTGTHLEYEHAVHCRQD